MKFSLAVFFCLLALATANVLREAVDLSSYLDDVDAANYALTGRIVNGTKAVSKQFAHQISLRRSWSARHFCGATLITPNHVLTAAHCLFQNKKVIEPWTIMLVGGELKLNKATKTGQRRGVEAIYMHPDFNTETLHNDIAILYVKTPFELTPELNIAPLPTQPLTSGSVCQVSGWGYPAANIPIVSNDLMYVDLPILTRDSCRALLENVTDLPSGMYCAGYMEGGRDACQGDSGGGMVCDGIVTGVVSGGEGCAFPRLPGVYADVFFYKSWINEHTTMQLNTRVENSGADGSNPAMFGLLFFMSMFRS